MPSLREMLEKQRQEKLNGSVKPILQSQPAKTTVEGPKAPAALPKENAGTEEPVREQSSGAGNAASGNSVVEQRPPAGLSGLALIRWKKEHAHVQTNATQNNAAPVLEQTQVQPVQNAEISQPAESKKPLTLAEKIKAKNANQQNNSNTVPARTSEVISPASAPATNPPQNPPVNNADEKPTGAVDGAALRTNLAYLANNIDQKELVGQIVRTIAVQLKQNPELTPLMTDADMDLMVRGLRRSFSTAARKKTEDREKKAGKKKGGEDLAAALKEAGLGDFSLDLS